MIGNEKENKKKERYRSKGKKKDKQTIWTRMNKSALDPHTGTITDTGSSRKCNDDR